MEQKRFVDIERVKLPTSDIAKSNVYGFEKGDHIVIQEKVDGANASIRYDKDNNCLVAFSRKKTLDQNNTLNGFYNYVLSLDVDKFITYHNYVFFGEWLCLSGDTIIRKTSAGKNSTYMTLRDMYKFLNAPTPDKYHYNKENGHLCVLYGIKEGYCTEEDIVSYYKKYNDVEEKYALRMITNCINKKYIELKDNKYDLTQFGMKHLEEIKIKNNWWHRNGMPSIFSLYQDEDVIKSNKIKNIVYTGEKEVYELTTRKGFKIKSTLEHPFLTPNGFVQLKNLKEKDCVAITQMQNTRRGRTYGKGSNQIIIKQNEHKEKIGKCERCGLEFCLELHHKDRNYKNNCLENWEVLCSECHKKEHSKDKFFNGFVYDYEFDYITSIKYVGIEDCYDIEMEGNENNANFVANGFIVHNCKHTIKYKQEAYKKFYFYDVFDLEKNQYLLQNEVRELANELGFTYVKTYYDGKFISWEHCKSFMEQESDISIGVQEGVVIKNDTKRNIKLYSPNNIRFETVLKLVNAQFSEIKKDNHIKKIEDPNHIKEREHCKEIVEKIVTKQRVHKEILKMIDEQLLPNQLSMQDMKTICKILPKRIYDDCMKEEREYVIEAGEMFGKMSSHKTMEFTKEIILGI